MTQASSSGMGRAFLTIVRRDLRLALRQGADSLLAVMFFVLVAILIPFGIGPDLDILGAVAGGVLWVAALLAALLSMERLFQADFEDGTLELLLLQPVPRIVTVLAKVTAHWLTSGVPLLLAAPVVGVMYDMTWEAIATLLLGLLVGTPSLSLIGGIGAALILGARRGGVLLSILILPLNVPVLIFGVTAVEAARSGFSPLPHLLILAALFLISLVVAPLAAQAALKQAVE